MRRLPSKKPPAEDRTIDLFTGTTHLEVLKGNIESPADAEDSRKESSETIEKCADRWRANAMFTAEHLSKAFNQGIPGKESFRLTEKDSILYLEKLTNDSKGHAYSYAGLMFNTESLYELANLFYKAAKERKNKESNG